MLMLIWGSCATGLNISHGSYSNIAAGYVMDCMFKSAKKQEIMTSVWYDYWSHRTGVLECTHPHRHKQFVWVWPLLTGFFFWQCVTAPTPEISSPFICSAFQVVCQLNEMRSGRLSCLLHCSVHSPTRKREKHYDHYEKMTNILFFGLIHCFVTTPNNVFAPVT